VRFRSGRVFSSAQWHAMEYGGSVDAIARLSSWIEGQIDSAPNDFPTDLVMMDQYGVAHAPFSFGRTYLVEAGFGEIDVWFHDDEGRLRKIKAKDLLPQHAPIVDVLETKPSGLSNPVSSRGKSSFCSAFASHASCDCGRKHTPSKL
jgi:hypothetical protein